MVTFSSFHTRNQILGLGYKLTKGMNIEKCVPRDYRAKNKEFLHIGWQLKIAMRNTIKTRVVFMGHLICLQVKKKDEGGAKFDWVIQKEWFPPQQKSGDRSEASRNRSGLTPTPEIQEKDRCFVIFTDLVPDPEGKKDMIDSFKKDYVEGIHQQQIKDTVDHTNKGIIMIKVMSKEICEHWEQHYAQKKFNGALPKIQLIG